MLLVHISEATRIRSVVGFTYDRAAFVKPYLSHGPPFQPSSPRGEGSGALTRDHHREPYHSPGLVMTAKEVIERGRDGVRQPRKFLFRVQR